MNTSPILGYIRYSCWRGYDINDFFDPEYLDYRLNIFKNITLKSLQQQTDKDFNVLILHSPKLPQNYKNIFKELENENPFLHNIYVPDTELYEQDYIDGPAGSINFIQFCNDISINFRIDNDDALPCDFISKLKLFLKPEFSGYFISIPQVSIIQRTHKDKFLKQEKYYPSNSMGLAFVTDKNTYKTLMSLGDHGKINQNFPVILLPGRGGIQTINGKNVMNSLYFGFIPAFNSASLSEFLKNNNYADFNFNCLNVKKRRLLLDIIIRTINFIKRYFQGK